MLKILVFTRFASILFVKRLDVYSVEATKNTEFIEEVRIVEATRLFVNKELVKVLAE